MKKTNEKVKVSAEDIEVKEVKSGSKDSLLTSIKDVEGIKLPEFGNMTVPAIKRWLVFNQVPEDMEILGIPVKLWKLSRKFNVTPEEMVKLAEKNNL